MSLALQGAVASRHDRTALEHEDAIASIRLSNAQIGAEALAPENPGARGCEHFGPGELAVGPVLLS